MSDLISREDAMAYIERVINSGLGRNKSLDYIHKYISALPSAEAVTIHEDGTLEIKVPNAHKVGRVLVMDTDSHIGGGLFYPDDAVQGFRGGKIPPKEMLDGTVLIPKHQWLEMERELAELKEKFESAEAEWIPCSERLPKAEDMYQIPEQRYLCQLEAHGERKFCVLSRLKGAVSPFWDWYGIAVYDSEVLAWMPLPTPYKGGDTE